MGLTCGPLPTARSTFTLSETRRKALACPICTVSGQPRVPCGGAGREQSCIKCSETSSKPCGQEMRWDNGPLNSSMQLPALRAAADAGRSLTMTPDDVLAALKASHLELREILDRFTRDSRGIHIERQDK